MTRFLDRFNSKWEADPATGCWNWTASLTASGGYGQFHTGAKPMRAHRVSYELHIGVIPAGHNVIQTCRNHRCVNPAHLQTATKQETTLRGNGPAARNAAKTHCANGHKFTPWSTHITTDGKRKCRLCASDRYYQRKAQA